MKYILLIKITYVLTCIVETTIIWSNKDLNSDTDLLFIDLVADFYVEESFLVQGESPLAN